MEDRKRPVDPRIGQSVRLARQSVDIPWIVPCCISRSYSPLARRGDRVIGTDTLRISVLLQVSSDDQERE